MPDEGIQEAEQAVDAVARRSAAAGGEGEIVALLLEQEAENAEIGDGAHAFGTAQAVHRTRLAQILRRPAAEVLDLAGERVGGDAQALALRSLLRLTGGAQEGVATVLEFAGNDLAGDGSAASGEVGGAKLGATQGHTGICHAGEAGLKIAEFTEKVDGDSLFPAKVQGGRRDRAGAEDAEGFQMMNGDA